MRDETRLKEAVNGTAREYDFPRIQKDTESYYVDHDNSENIMEYDFRTVPEMKRMMEKMCDNEMIPDEMKVICAVAAFKRKPTEKEADVTAAERRVRIPDFVYTL